LDQARQELGVAPVLGDGLLGADLERVQDARETQPSQVKRELLGLLGGAHRRPPAAASKPAANSPAWRRKVRLRGSGGGWTIWRGAISSPVARMRLSVG